MSGLNDAATKRWRREARIARREADELREHVARLTLFILRDQVVRREVGQRFEIVRAA